MREFVVRASGMDKWMHQNRAEYMGDHFDGSLLDNFVLACKRGYAFVYEKYETAWTSNYLVKFAEYGKDDELDGLWREWREREREFVDWVKWNDGRVA